MAADLSRTVSNQKFGQILTRALILPIALMFLLLGLLFFQVRNLVTSMQWVDHTDLAIAQANQIRFDLISLQNDLRGYAVIGSSDLLKSYQSTDRSLDSDIEKFRATVADNPSQQQRVVQIKARVAEWREWANRVLLSAQSSRAGAYSAVESGQGGRGMVDIQNWINSAIQTEEGLRQERSGVVQSDARRAVVFAIVVTAFLGTILAYFTRRQLLNLAVIYGQSQDLISQYAAQEAARAAEAKYRQLVDSVKDYAIIMLDPQGFVTSWTTGAEKIKGYQADEIIGKHFTTFYTPEDKASGKAELELQSAAKEGRFEDEGWRVRKDGTRFWANVILVPLRDLNGNLMGYGKITRDLTQRKKTEDEMRKNSIALSAANKELEAFSYAVSHDLRAPLRGVDGFSQALMEDYGDRLDEEGKDYLKRVRAGVQRMGKLIDDLLNLSRLTRGQMRIGDLDLSKMAREIIEELRERDPSRKVDVKIQEGLVSRGDSGLLGAALENLLSNAWKFSSKNPQARIEFGATELNGELVYFVRDNGAGFDMAYADKLFGAFQRLHHADDFQGTGVGLATVRRVIHRHGGRIWVDAKEGQGATFYFTINTPGQENLQAA
ncbi:MAG: PAS domain S-box protein [Bdellovibrionia bacterium]